MGEIVIVFDPVIWGGRDHGNNDHCWKEAELLRTYQKGSDKLADVRFLHDGRISHGHFPYAIRKGNYVEA